MPVAYRCRPVETADGHTLALYRLEAGGGPPRPPVLLLPGMGANRFTFGLRPGVGLPARLAEDGWDVWLAELRGARATRPPVSGVPEMAPHAKLTRDMPALLDAIRGETGAAQVSLVGHSLGGLLALLTAGLAPDGGRATIGAIVTLCTPGFSPPQTPLPAIGASLTARLASGLAGHLRGEVPVAPLARLVRGAAAQLAPTSHFLRGGTDPEVLRDYFLHAVEDIPLAEAAALLDWRLRGQLSVTGGAPGGLAGWLGRVRVPVLGVAANRDGVATPKAARAAWEAVGSAERAWLTIGRELGARADYAHADVLLGRDAEDDVVAPIRDWLRGLRTSR